MWPWTCAWCFYEVVIHSHYSKIYYFKILIYSKLKIKLLTKKSICLCISNRDTLEKYFDIVGLTKDVNMSTWNQSLNYRRSMTFDLQITGWAIMPNKSGKSWINIIKHAASRSKRSESLTLKISIKPN